MKSKTRRALLALMFVLTICMTAKTTEVLIRRHNETELAVESISVDDQDYDPISAFRKERQQLRQMQRSQLNDIIYGQDGDVEIIQLARRQMLELMETEEIELNLEGILRMRGWNDALVTVNDNSVNVVIRCKSLSRQESAVILELVMRETSISGGNVKIIPIN